ncbi:MAG TPA: hypothetical protein VGH24_10245 [Solirubrobacteraceae bacterium]
MTSPGTLPPAQLLVYEFGPEGTFEGQLGGALERFEGSTGLRVLEAMLIRRAADTGELEVIQLRGGGAGGLISPILDFRLDPAARRRSTERALAPGGTGIAPDTLRELGSALTPGAAMAALLIEHRWAEVLEEAVASTGGSRLANEFVEARTLAELESELGSAASRRTASVRRP